jgi:hypothetical protein
MVVFHAIIAWYDVKLADTKLIKMLSINDNVK